MKEKNQENVIQEGIKTTGTRNKRNPQGTAFSAEDRKQAQSRQKQPRTQASSALKTRENTHIAASKQKAEKDTKNPQARTTKKKINAPKNSKANFEVETETKTKTKQRLHTKANKKTDSKPVDMPLAPNYEWFDDDFPKKRINKRHSEKAVKIVFLGGVDEIGKNMTAFEYENDIIVVDAGLSFPNIEDMPGIDSVIPDVTYLAQNKDKIRGIFLTHGHEDHIGGLPYLMKEIMPTTPIFGTKLTLMLANSKLQEHRILNADERVVQAGDRIRAGKFEVEFVNVNHSISGACALAIHTPQGIIYHSGDFKIDLTPVSGESIDFKRIAELGKEGVLLYMGESTNIERPGYTMSETVVGTTLDHLFAENVGRRMVIATFSSNVHRLQQIMDLVKKYNRKVALSGRSMLKVVEAATQIDELHIPDGLLIDIEQSKNIPDGELLILSTGAQGEPMSALTRMAAGEFNKVTIGENDTIIISATPIPGNEKMVYRVINNLYKKGARVVYESLEKIHVSGHACQEEHKILHSLLKPKFFIPIHGEYRHLKRHAQLAHSLGMPERNILIPEIGNLVELTKRSMSIGGNVPAGMRLVDGEGMEDYSSSVVMKERLKMSADGVYSVAVAVTGDHIMNAPVIQTVGCMGLDPVLMNELEDVLQRTIASYDYANGNRDDLAICIRKNLKNYFYKRKKQAPLMLVSVLEL